MHGSPRAFQRSTPDQAPHCAVGVSRLPHPLRNAAFSPREIRQRSGTGQASYPACHHRDRLGGKNVLVSSRDVERSARQEDDDQSGDIDKRRADARVAARPNGCLAPDPARCFPAVLLPGAALGRCRADFVAAHPGGRDCSPHGPRPARVASTRNAVRLCGRGHRGIPPDGHSELDRPPSHCGDAPRHVDRSLVDGTTWRPLFRVDWTGRCGGN